MVAELTARDGTTAPELEIGEFEDRIILVRGTNEGLFGIRTRTSYELQLPGELDLLKPLLEHFGNHFRFVLLGIGAEVSDPVLFECLTHSALTYLFFRQSQENHYDFDALLREARSRFNGDCSRIKTVLCLGEGERARPTRSLRLRGPSSVTFPVRIFHSTLCILHLDGPAIPAERSCLR